jgi:Ca2+-binding RTX toxin-like protein
MQQIRLFNNIYNNESKWTEGGAPKTADSYFLRARKHYDEKTRDPTMQLPLAGRVAWESLDPVVRDVLVDFVYQGYYGATPMRMGMKNDVAQLITYIQSNPSLKKDEDRGRQRVNHLTKSKQAQPGSCIANWNVAPQFIQARSAKGMQVLPGAIEFRGATVPLPAGTCQQFVLEWRRRIVADPEKWTPWNGAAVFSRKAAKSEDAGPAALELSASAIVLPDSVYEFRLQAYDSSQPGAISAAFEQKLVVTTSRPRTADLIPIFLGGLGVDSSGENEVVLEQRIKSLTYRSPQSSHTFNSVQDVDGSAGYTQPLPLHIDADTSTATACGYWVRPIPRIPSAGAVYDSRGKYYFAPGIAAPPFSIPGDQDSKATGYQGDVELVVEQSIKNLVTNETKWVELRPAGPSDPTLKFTIDAGATRDFSLNDAAGKNWSAALFSVSVAQIQQRLRFLGYRGVTGSGVNQQPQWLVIDGIAGPSTRHALTTLRNAANCDESAIVNQPGLTDLALLQPGLGMAELRAPSWKNFAFSGMDANYRFGSSWIENALQKIQEKAFTGLTIDKVAGEARTQKVAVEAPGILSNTNLHHQDGTQFDLKCGDNQGAADALKFIIGDFRNQLHPAIGLDKVFVHKDLWAAIKGQFDVATLTWIEPSSRVETKTMHVRFKRGKGSGSPPTASLSKAIHFVSFNQLSDGEISKSDLQQVLDQFRDIFDKALPEEKDKNLEELMHRLLAPAKITLREGAYIALREELLRPITAITEFLDKQGDKVKIDDLLSNGLADYDSVSGELTFDLSPEISIVLPGLFNFETTGARPNDGQAVVGGLEQDLLVDQGNADLQFTAPCDIRLNLRANAMLRVPVANPTTSRVLLENVQFGVQVEGTGTAPEAVSAFRIGALRIGAPTIEDLDFSIKFPAATNHSAVAIIGTTTPPSMETLLEFLVGVGADFSLPGPKNKIGTVRVDLDMLEEESGFSQASGLEGTAQLSIHLIPKTDPRPRGVLTNLTADTIVRQRSRLNDFAQVFVEINGELPANEKVPMVLRRFSFLLAPVVNENRGRTRIETLELDKKWVVRHNDKRAYDIQFVENLEVPTKGRFEVYAAQVPERDAIWQLSKTFLVLNTETDVGKRIKSYQNVSSSALLGMLDEVAGKIEGSLRTNVGDAAKAWQIPFTNAPLADGIDLRSKIQSLILPDIGRFAVATPFENRAVKWWEVKPEDLTFRLEVRRKGKAKIIVIKKRDGLKLPDDDKLLDENDPGVSQDVRDARAKVNLIRKKVNRLRAFNAILDDCLNNESLEDAFKLDAPDVNTEFTPLELRIDRGSKADGIKVFAAAALGFQHGIGLARPKAQFDDQITLFLTVDGEFSDSLLLDAPADANATPQARLNEALRRAVAGTNYAELPDFMEFAQTPVGNDAYLWIKWNDQAKEEQNRAFRTLQIDGDEKFGYLSTVVTLEHVVFEPLSLQSVVRALNSVVPEAKLQFSTKTEGGHSSLVADLAAFSIDTVKEFPLGSWGKDSNADSAQTLLDNVSLAGNVSLAIRSDAHLKFSLTLDPPVAAPIAGLDAVSPAIESLNKDIKGCTAGTTDETYTITIELTHKFDPDPEKRPEDALKVSKNFFVVDLGGAQTLQQVVGRITAKTEGKVKAEVVTDSSGSRFRLEDLTIAKDETWTEENTANFKVSVGVPKPYINRVWDVEKKQLVERQEYAWKSKSLIGLALGIVGQDVDQDGIIIGTDLIDEKDLSRRLRLDADCDIRCVGDFRAKVESGRVDLGLLSLAPKGSSELKLDLKFTARADGSSPLLVGMADTQLMLALNCDQNFKPGTIWDIAELKEAIEEFNQKARIEVHWSAAENCAKTIIPPGLDDLQLKTLFNSEKFRNALASALDNAAQLSDKLKALGPFTAELPAFRFKLEQLVDIDAILNVASARVASELQKAENAAKQLGIALDLSVLERILQQSLGNGIKVKYVPSPNQAFIFVPTGYDKTLSRQLNLNLTHEGKQLLSVGKQGEMGASLTIDLGIGIGVDLKDFTSFLSCPDTQMKASLDLQIPTGPVEVIVGPFRRTVAELKADGLENGHWKKSFSYELPDTGEPDQRVYELPDPITTNFNFDFTLQPPQIQLPDFDVQQHVAFLGQGWQTINSELARALRSELAKHKIPVIGASAADALDVFTALEEAFSGDWLRLDGLSGPIADQEKKLADQLEKALRDAVGQDLKLQNTKVNLTAKTIRTEFRLEKTKRTTTEVDLGLDGLKMRLSPRPQLVTDSTLTLAGEQATDFAVLGFDDRGMYLENLRLLIKAEATIDPSQTFDTDIGFLRFRTTLDDHELNGATFHLSLTLAPKNTQSRIGDLFKSAGSPEFGMAAGFNIKQLESLSFGDVVPRFRTSFAFNLPPKDGKPVASFGNVEMHVGDFAKDVMGPVVDEVTKSAGPVLEISDKLEQPVPIISKFVGNFTFFDLALLLVEKQENRETILRFREAIRHLRDIQKKIDTMASGAWVPVGDFSIAGAAEDVLDESKAGSLKPEYDKTVDLSGPFKDIAKGLNEDYHPIEMTSLASQSALSPQERRYLLEYAGNFVFPLIEDIKRFDESGNESPTSASTPRDVIFGLLLGNDATIFEYRIPRLSYEFQYSQFFPILGPLGCRVGGRTAGEATIAIGYDTSAIRQHRDAVQGFYLNDRIIPGGTGRDIPEAVVMIGFFAAGEVNVVVARAGVEGGLFGELAFDLKDCGDKDKGYLANDGKVYLEEFLDGNPLDAFQMTASVYAQLRAYIEIGFRALGKFVCIFCQEKKFAKVVIFEKAFNAECKNSGSSSTTTSHGQQLQPENSILSSFVSLLEPAVQPELKINGDASLDLLELRYAEGVLTEHRWKTENNRQSRKVEVYRNLAANTKIVFDGTDQKDVVIVGPEVPFEVELNGNGGDDHMTHEGTGPCTINGGLGDDTLIGSNYVDEKGLVGDKIHGDGGNDTINGRRGNDWLWGDGGSDTLRGGQGNDHLFGGDDDDTLLDGGPGDDWLWGGNNKDTLLGGAGNDVLIGGDGQDTLGDPANETGQDVLIAASLTGHGLTLTEEVQPLDEEAYKTTNNAVLIGFIRASEWIRTKKSKTSDERHIQEWITGGDDQDLLLGGPSADFLVGSDGINVLDGNEGNDWIWGGKGDDQIHGNDGNDVLFGNDGDDTIEGSLGQDVLVGGAGNDRLFAKNFQQPGVNQTYVVDKDDQGQHELFGGDVQWSNDDLLDELDGNDLIIGSNGPNLVIAGNGENIIWTGDGTDQILSRAWRFNKLAFEQQQAGEPLDDPMKLVPPETLVKRRSAGPTKSVVHAGKGSNEIHVGHGENQIWLVGSGVEANERNIVTTGENDDQIATTHNDQKFPERSEYQKRQPHLTQPEHLVFQDWPTFKNSNTAARLCMIDSGSGTDLIISGDGNDWVKAFFQEDVSAQSTERDVVFVGDGINVVNVDNGDNYVEAAGSVKGYSIIIGTNGDDVIRGGKQNDFILAGEGNDLIFGGDGDDIIVAGVKELKVTNKDEDTVHGGPGNDLIIGGIQSDYLAGDEGNDIVIGGNPGKIFDELPIEALGEFYDQARKLHHDADQPDARKEFEKHYDAIFNEWSKSISQLPSFDKAEKNAVKLFGDAKGAEERVQYPFPEMVPAHLRGSQEGDDGDGRDSLLGGDGDDWLFGGAESDLLFGGNGNDYLDAGSGNDELYGGWPNEDQAIRAQFDVNHGFEAGEFKDGKKPEAKGKGTNDDVLIAGPGNDILKGGWGIDQLFGDDGDDLLFGDQGYEETPDGKTIQQGQRLWGGAGVDFLHAYSTPADFALDIQLRKTAENAGKPLNGLFHPIGDELIGGGGGDFLYGSLRRDLLIGDSFDEPSAGDDFLHGDYFKDAYKINENAGWTGGADMLYGNRGSDQLFGGGGDDILWGGQDGDWLEGMAGTDRLYGGSGPDILVADVDSRYFYTNETGEGEGPANVKQELELTDGHFGNVQRDDSLDDAVDILLVQGDATFSNRTESRKQEHDRIVIRDFGKTMLRIDYTSFDTSESVGLAPLLDCELPAKAGSGPNQQKTKTGRPLSGLKNRFIDIKWRPDQDDAPPLIEQIHVAGLMGDDRILLDLSDDTTTKAKGLFKEDPTGPLPLEIWFSVLSGGPGNDIIVGSSARDQIFGGPGSDMLYGMSNDDRLWGDILDGDPEDIDYLFAGAGNDDLIGGVGSNRLYAWSYHPWAELKFPYIDRRFPEAAQSAEEAVHKQWRDSVFLFLDNQYELKTYESRGWDVSKYPDGKPKIFGVFVDGDRFVVPVADKYEQEQTGLNRMLGSDNESTSDYLYGGTQLDFLYGRGGDDTIYKKDGKPFEATTPSSESASELWKEYARTIAGALYIATSNSADKVEINYVTNPSSDLYGHHLINISTAGSVDFRYATSDFQFKTSAGQPLQPYAGRFYDTSSLLLTDKRMPQLVESSAPLGSRRADLAAGPSSLFQLGSQVVKPPSDESGFQRVSESVRRRSVEIASSLQGDVDEERLLAIIIDALDGNDEVHVRETVQKTVWIDAGKGHDYVRIEPQRAYLPDRAEQTAAMLKERISAVAGKGSSDQKGRMIKHVLPDGSIKYRMVSNDLPQFAYDLKIVSGTSAYRDLTIDTGNQASIDEDWYRFALAEDLDLNKGDDFVLTKTDQHHPTQVEGRVYASAVLTNAPDSAEAPALMRVSSEGLDALQKPNTGKLPRARVTFGPLQEGIYGAILSLLQQEQLSSEQLKQLRELWNHIPELKQTPSLQLNAILEVHRYSDRRNLAIRDGAGPKNSRDWMCLFVQPQMIQASRVSFSSAPSVCILKKGLDFAPLRAATAGPASPEFRSLWRNVVAAGSISAQANPDLGPQSTLDRHSPRSWILRGITETFLLSLSADGLTVEALDTYFLRIAPKQGDPAAPATYDVVFRFRNSPDLTEGQDIYDLGSFERKTQVTNLTLHQTELGLDEDQFSFILNRPVGNNDALHIFARPRTQPLQVELLDENGGLLKKRDTIGVAGPSALAPTVAGKQDEQEIVLHLADYQNDAPNKEKFRLRIQAQRPPPDQPLIADAVSYRIVPEFKYQVPAGQDPTNPQTPVSLNSYLSTDEFGPWTLQRALGAVVSLDATIVAAAVDDLERGNLTPALIDHLRAKTLTPASNRVFVIESRSRWELRIGPDSYLITLKDGSSSIRKVTWSTGSFDFSVAEKLESPVRLALAVDVPRNGHVAEPPPAGDSQSKGPWPKLCLQMRQRPTPADPDGKLIAQCETTTRGRPVVLDLSMFGLLELTAERPPLEGLYVSKDIQFAIVIDDQSYDVILKKDADAKPGDNTTTFSAAELLERFRKRLQDAISEGKSKDGRLLRPYQLQVHFENGRLVISVPLGIVSAEVSAEKIAIRDAERLGFLEYRNADSIDGGEKIPYQETSRKPAVIKGDYCFTVSVMMPSGMPEDFDALERIDRAQWNLAKSIAHNEGMNAVDFSILSLNANLDKYTLRLENSDDVNLSGRSTFRRKDVIIGGPGNDRLIGGSAEDWIFGGSGNDVLSGGADGQSSDLLFGDEGDDLFQLIPDRLPISSYYEIPFDPATADMLFGGPGHDRVYFLGGDLEHSSDAAASPLAVRDFVALGYDRFLGRHRLMSLVWDCAHHRFVGTPRDSDQTLIYQFEQRFAFFQCKEIEGTLIDTRGGGDIVHLDPHYFSPSLGEKTWGIARGDVQSGASAYRRIEVRGGAGDDVIYGSDFSDILLGADGNDILVGHQGDDHIVGGNDHDQLYGDQWLAPPESLPILSAGTPDDPDPVFSRATNRKITAFDYARDLATPDSQCFVAAGVSPSNMQPAERPVVANLSNSFAMDGTPNQQLSGLISVGDFNGDGFGDFLATGDGATADAHLLYGPLSQERMYRVGMRIEQPRSAIGSRPPKTMTVRGSDWSYEVPIRNDRDLDPLLERYSVKGQGSIILPAFGAVAPRVSNAGQILATQFQSGSYRVVYAEPSASFDESKLGDTRWKTVTIPKPLIKPSESASGILPPSASDIGLHPLDFNGDGKQEIFVHAKLPAKNAPEIGWIVDLSGLDQNQKPLRALTVDPDRQTPQRKDGTKDTTIGRLLLGEDANFVPQDGSFTAIVPGDVDGDGNDDLLIGDSNFITLSNRTVGRVYLVLAKDIAADNIELSKASAIWEGFGMGDTVFSLGDVNADGLADFGFAQSFENCADDDLAGQGSVFLIQGSPRFKEVRRYYSVNKNLESGKPQWPHTTDSFVFCRLRDRGPAGSQQIYRHGKLDVTSGDLTGDGEIDLVVSTMGNVVSDSESANQAGAALPHHNQLLIFNSIWQKAQSSPSSSPKVPTIRLDEFNTKLVPDQSQRHVFSGYPMSDLDGDGVVDLVAGVPQCAGLSTTLTNLGLPTGRNYVVHGDRVWHDTPPRIETVTNRDVPGLGLFVVQPATNRPYSHPAEMTFLDLRSDCFRVDDPSAWNLEVQRLANSIATVSHTGRHAAVVSPDSRGPNYEIGAWMKPGPAPASSNGSYIILNYEPLSRIWYEGLPKSPTPDRYVMAGINHVFEPNQDYWQFEIRTQSKLLASAPVVENYFARDTWFDIRVRVTGSQIELYSRPESGTVSTAANYGAPKLSVHYEKSKNDASLIGELAGVLSDFNESHFRNFFVRDTERWFKFSTLGDGQPGNQIKVRVDAQYSARDRAAKTPPRYATSKPLAEHRYSTTGDPVWESDVVIQHLGVSVEKTEESMDVLGIVPNDATTDHPFKVGGPRDARALMAFDFSCLQTHIESFPPELRSASLKIRYRASNLGRLVLECLDDEPDFNKLAGAQQQELWKDLYNKADAKIFSPIEPYRQRGVPGAVVYNADDDFIDFDLTATLERALLMGRSRLVFRLKATEGFVQALTWKDFNEPSETYLKLEVNTRLRRGLWFDLFDGQGRKLQSNRTIADGRALKAGQYWLRIFDPFGINDLAPTWTSPLPLEVVLNPPKVGDSHAPTDIDALFGDDGHDLLAGNGFVDQLHGGPGIDCFLAQPMEIKDDRYLATLPAFSSSTAPSGSDEARGDVETSDVVKEDNLPLRLDGPVVWDSNDSTLQRIVSHALGHTRRNWDNKIVITSKVYVSDMTRLQALNLANITFNLPDTTPPPPNPLGNLEFATNLEYLTLAGTNVSDLSPLYPGVHILGRQNQARFGQLGIHSLRYLDLDYSSVNNSAKNLADGSPLNALRVVGEQSNLIYLSADDLQGTESGQKSNYAFWQLMNEKCKDQPTIEALQSLRFLSAMGNRLYSTRGLALSPSDPAPMRFVNLSWNPIEDLGALEQWPKIELEADPLTLRPGQPPPTKCEVDEQLTPGPPLPP